MFRYYDNIQDVFWHIARDHELWEKFVILRLPDGRFRVENISVDYWVEPPPEPPKQRTPSPTR